MKLTCSLIRDAETWRAKGVTVPRSLLLTGPAGSREDGDLGLSWTYEGRPIRPWKDVCPPMFLASMQLGGPLKHLLMLAVPLILLALTIALRLRQSIRRHYYERLGRTIARDRSLPTDGPSLLDSVPIRNRAPQNPTSEAIRLARLADALIKSCYLALLQ
jgi:hypothetical protein